MIAAGDDFTEAQEGNHKTEKRNKPMEIGP